MIIYPWLKTCLKSNNKRTKHNQSQGRSRGGGERGAYGFAEEELEDNDGTDDGAGDGRWASEETPSSVYHLSPIIAFCFCWNSNQIQSWIYNRKSKNNRAIYFCLSHDKKNYQISESKIYNFFLLFIWFECNLLFYLSMV